MSAADNAGMVARLRLRQNHQMLELQEIVQFTLLFGCQDAFGVTPNIYVCDASDGARVSKIPS